MNPGTALVLLSLVLTSRSLGADVATRRETARPPLLKPPPLVAGDTIGLVAPAGPLAATSIRAAQRNLEQRGYRVKVTSEAEASLGYLAGSDRVRLRSLHEMLRDEDVKAILCLRGGYGSPRLLDSIDYDLLRRHPKIFIGYSDITALHLAAGRETGLVVFHGPMGKEWARGSGLTPFSETYYWDAFHEESPRFADWGGRRGGHMKSPSTIAPGVAEGPLVGGNLSVICGLMGTRYEIDTRGAIFFLEDVGEKLFRIDRMLNQLRLSGKLADARGILLGAFAECETRAGDIGLREVLEDYCLPLQVPVLADFPAGHVPDNATLPLGVRVRLDAGAGRLTLMESPVRGSDPPR